MIIKKNSEAYKGGIRYKPNLDTIIPNAEKAAYLLGLLPYPKNPVYTHNNYPRLPDGIITPIEKKLEW